MPKAGETPEMGANPLLGFGRVYARPRGRARRRPPGAPAAQRAGPHLRAVLRLAPGPRHHAVGRGGRHAREHLALRRGEADRPDGRVPPVRLAAQGVAPLRVVHGLPHGAAASGRGRRASARCSSTTARRAGGWSRSIEAAYPGMRRENVHVWTLRGKSRVARLGKLWEEWKALGVHLVEDGWKAPSGLEVFTDSGTYAPTFLVGSWKDAAGRHPRLPLRRLRRHRRGDAGGEPLRGARRRRDDVDVLAELRAAVRRRGAADAARPRRARLRAEDRRAVRRARGGGGEGADLRGGDPRGRGLEHAAREARAARRRLPAREGLERARQHRLHVRRPVQRHPGRDPGRARASTR